MTPIPESQYPSLVYFACSVVGTALCITVVWKATTRPEWQVEGSATPILSLIAAAVLATTIQVPDSWGSALAAGGVWLIVPVLALRRRLAEEREYERAIKILTRLHRWDNLDRDELLTLGSCPADIARAIEEAERDGVLQSRHVVQQIDMVLSGRSPTLGKAFWHVEFELP